MKLKSRWFKFPKCGASPFNFLYLYRFASKWEFFLIIVGCVFTLFKASIFPLIAITYAEITSLLVERTYRIGTSTPTRYLRWFGGGRTLTNATAEENDAEIINDSIAYLYATIFISLIQLVAEIISLSCFNYTAISQVTRIRIKYFTSLMRQDIGWHDLQKSKSNFTVRLDEDIDKIKAGIGEQASHFLNTALTTIFCIFTAFAFGWQLTLIVITYLPIVFTLNYVVGKFRVVLSIKELNAHATAANVVEEVLRGIRTVFAFGGEHMEVERYEQHLQPAQKVVEAKTICACIEDGTVSCLYFFSSALAFWFGVNWVLDDRDKIDKTYTTSILITVFINLTVAVENIVRLPPLMDIFTLAHASAKNIFAIIDQKSKLDPMRSGGKILDNMKIKGDIEFKDVSFGYPARSNVQILNGLNLKIEGGQTVALVGDSGNGKSTCVQLLQRFYDPNRGTISIDGCDIRSLNINSLRSFVACVGQDPVIFSTTISENIRYGRPNATDREIMAAARSSGAHNFIVNLPQSYNTVVSEGGSQFSGGQKQQIAIARALLQNPKILLLDEATAALDYHAEKHIQDILDRASKGRTTIVVSHRMSAIKNADRIVFIHNGQIVEDGTHDALIALNGHYYEMVKSTHHELERDDGTKIDNTVDQTPEEVPRHGEIFKQTRTNEIKLEEERETEDAIAFWESFKRIPSLIKSDRIILSIAICSSVILGFITLLFSIIFAEVFAVMSIRNKDEATQKLTVYCLVFVGSGILAFIATILQTAFFAKIGANLARRLRLMAFSAILRQECGWFDRKENAVGILTSHLSGDAANVQNAIGFPISAILQSSTVVVLGVIIAFSISLKLSIICAIPIIMITALVLMEQKSLSKSVMAEKHATAYGMKVASEAIANIRTVASLRQEKGAILRFSKEAEKVRKVAKKSIMWRSVLSSMNQMLSTSAYGFALSYGGVMVAHHEIYYKDVIRISELLLYGVMTMGQTLVFAPTIATAFISVYRLLKIIDRNPLIGSPRCTKKSQAIDQRNDVSFKQVDFRYSTRPAVQILNGLNLHVSQGQTVALVGPSGSGKTTCVQLLQRFYDPENGRVIIGDDEISRDITLKDLRSKLSIVSQEPTLFDRTIAENIAYGDNDRKVEMNEIIEAAKTANVHNFIVQLPQGYETKVGCKATQLSGGQKQKIAIARALIRNPKILILDEATSALDLQSEMAIQQALNSVQTCIIVAHRLSSIKNVDVICVMHNGKIVETGGHSELIAMNGVYTKLYQAQKQFPEKMNRSLSNIRVLAH